MRSFVWHLFTVDRRSEQGRCSEGFAQVDPDCPTWMPLSLSQGRQESRGSDLLPGFMPACVQHAVGWTAGNQDCGDQRHCAYFRNWTVFASLKFLKKKKSSLVSQAVAQYALCHCVTGCSRARWNPPAITHLPVKNRLRTLVISPCSFVFLQGDFLL